MGSNDHCSDFERKIFPNLDLITFTQYDSNLHFADKSIKENKNFLLKHFPLHVVFRYCSSKILQDKEIFIDGLNLDIRLLQRRGMSPAQMLDMEYEGVQATQRHKIFTYYRV